MDVEAENCRKKKYQVGDNLPGGYEIFDIKRGGMGVVYMVQHPELIPFAVKTFEDKYLMDNNVIGKFWQEARTWLRLGHHPHIVQSHFIETIDYKPYLFLEYVKGGSLKDWIENKRLYNGGKGKALERTLDIAIQVAQGLYYAHEKGVIHQDVKPANVMMTGDGTAKVTDFGLAKARAVTGEVGGDNLQRSILVSSGGMTPAYCSPEQANKQSLSRKTDIWSWGVSVLHMFTGDVFWGHGQAAPEALGNYLENGHEDDSITKMPELIVELLQKCFQYDPNERPKDMQEIAGLLGCIYQQTYCRPWSPPEFTPAPARSPIMRLSLQAKYLKSLNEYKEAINVCNEALSIEPESHIVLQTKGLICNALGNNVEAIDCLQRALVSGPDDVGILDNLAYCSNEMGRYGQALVFADRSTFLEAHNFSAWNNKGVAHMNLGHFEQAVSAFRQALEYNSNSAEAWNNLGFLLENLGKVEEAISCFQQAIELNPRYVKAYFNFSKLLFEATRVEEALTVIDKILAIEPNNTGALNIRSHLVEYLRQL